MTKISEARSYGLTIRESATDGSDFTNPEADYRRLFLGEDGALHLKDSAGAITDISVGGAAAYVLQSLADAKGDLIAATANDTFADTPRPPTAPTSWLTPRSLMAGAASSTSTPPP